MLLCVCGVVLCAEVCLLCMCCVFAVGLLYDVVCCSVMLGVCCVRVVLLYIINVLLCGVLLCVVVCVVCVCYVCAVFVV